MLGHSDSVFHEDGISNPATVVHKSDVLLTEL